MRQDSAGGPKRDVVAGGRLKVSSAERSASALWVRSRRCAESPTDPAAAHMPSHAAARVEQNSTRAVAPQETDVTHRLG